LEGIDMKAERSFFESLAETASPGWTVRLEAHMEPGGMALAAMGVRLYLVDTSSGWVGAGALSAWDFEVAHLAARELRRKRIRVEDMAGQQLGSLGASRPEAGAPELMQTINLAVLAISLTESYKKVLPLGLDGHWFYIGYRGHDASMVCRPVFVMGQPGQFMPEGEITGLVRQVVAMDLGNPASSVSIQLKGAGGPLLASMYRAA
jgi:hypothetical protein